MALTIDKPYLVLRTGMLDGKLIALVWDGDCAAGITDNKPQLTLRTGISDGEQVQLFGDQQVNPDGSLILNKPYLAVRSGMIDGKVVALVAGKDCDEGGEDQPFCNCTICCTLEATVQFPAPTTFGTAVDTTLTCGGSFVIEDIHLCNEDAAPENIICTSSTLTYSGGTGTLVVGMTTWNRRTVIWVSPTETDGPEGLAYTGVGPPDHGEITFTGNFKVYFTATEYVNAADEEEKYCVYEYGVLAEYEITYEFSTCLGTTGWGFWYKNTVEHPTGAPGGVWYTVSDCDYPSNGCCPPDYTDGSPEGTILGAVCTGHDPGYATDHETVSLSGCINDNTGDPIAISHEHWYYLVSDPTTRIDCIKFSIADLC